MRSAGRVLAQLAVLTVLAASSCSTAGPGLQATVDQFRDGYATGTIVLQLTDTGSAEFTVVSAALSDPRFSDGTAWTGSTQFAPGQTISLPAVAAAPRCDGSQDAAPTVRVRLADGTERRVAADDPHGVLARIHADGCFAARVASDASLSLDDALAPGPEPGVAILTVRAGAPPGPPPAASPILTSVSGTTLLDEDHGQPWPRGVVLSPGTEVRLAVRPARCDPHAVAEDKVGTVLPLTLAASGQTGVVKLAAPPGLRAAIYAFVAAACGWPTG